MGAPGMLTVLREHRLLHGEISRVLVILEFQINECISKLANGQKKQ